MAASVQGWRKPGRRRAQQLLSLRAAAEGARVVAARHRAEVAATAGRLELSAEAVGHETCSPFPAATSSVPAVVRAGRRPRRSRTVVPRLAGRHLMAGTTSERAALTGRHDPLLTVAQAGDYLGTGERFVRRLIAQRRITYVKLGKYVRLQRSTLDDFIEAGRVASGG